MHIVQWQYKTLKFEPRGVLGGKTNPAHIEDSLNVLGREGWEVTGVIETTSYAESTREIVVLLKRPKVAEKTRRDDNATVHINRFGQRLGAWKLEEIRGFLDSGNLRGNDEYYDTSAEQWLPLDQHPFL